MKKDISKAKFSYEEFEGCTPEEVRRLEVDEFKGFQEIKCLIVFDVKMNFTCKARYVINGSMNGTPMGLFYLSVVSRDSIIIAFLVAVLNDLDILACDISKHISQCSMPRENLVCCRP